MGTPTHPDIDDLNIIEEIPLFSPAYIVGQMPLDQKTEASIKENRRATNDILQGNSDRLLVVAWPCSIHNKKSAQKYWELIAEARRKHGKDLEIVMRAYFEKPRTTTGWEGFIADPKLDASYDTNHGLYQARKLLLHLASKWVPTATEFVSVTSPQFYADLVTYGAIWARTAESQEHRKLTSGLSMPTGIKNATNGSVQVAVDGIISARHSHRFQSITKHGTHALFRTKGNDGAHLILRGWATWTNFDSASVLAAVQLLKKTKLPEHLVIDASHGNSNKDYRNQPKVTADIAKQISDGTRVIVWTMIESHIKEWTQKMEWHIDPEISITDSCVSWETTEAMFEELAQAVRARRSK